MLTDEERQELRELPEVKDTGHLFDKLQGDLEKLRTQLRAHKKATPTSMLLRQVGRKSNAPVDPTKLKKLEITGARLSATSTIPSLQKFTDTLENDPTNSKARLELVQEFLRKGHDDGLMQCRDAYLLAMLEVDSPVVNTDKLRIAMKAQKVYLAKMLWFLQDDFSTLSQSSESPDVLPQITRSVKFIKEINNILPYHNFDSKESVEMDAKKLSKMGRSELETTLSPILEGISALPLAKTNQAILMEVLESTTKISPLSGYHMSRIYRRTAQLHLIAAMTGDKEQAKPSVEFLSKSLKSINAALPMMKKATRSDLSSCVREYALICLMVYQYLPRLGGSINAEHIKRMEHASKLLSRIHDERGVASLQQKLDAGIKYIKTEKPQGPDRGRKSKEEVEKEAETPTFFKGDIPKDKMLNSDEEVKPGKESTIFGKSLPKDKMIGE